MTWLINCIVMCHKVTILNILPLFVSLFNFTLPWPPAAFTPILRRFHLSCWKHRGQGSLAQSVHSRAVRPRPPYKRKRRNKNERKKFWCNVGTEKSYKFKELVKCLADLSGRQLWLVCNGLDLLKEIDFLHARFICFLPQNVVLK